MLWRPGTSELPPAPSRASIPASPLQQEAGVSASCLSGHPAALTTESRRHWLANALEEPGRERPEQARLGYRRNQAGWSRAGIPQRSYSKGLQPCKGWALLH